jgi:integrase
MQAACRWKNPRHLGQFFYPSEPEPRDRVLTREEVRRLVDSASAYHIRLFIHLAYGTAARAGALYELQWSQVDLDAETINLGRKANGKSRAIVPMTKTLKEALQEAQEIAETDYVLEYAGRPIRSARTGFKAACKRAGIDAFRIHDLRHTAAVHQIEAGVPIEMVSQYLGHANIAITAKHYARYRPQMMGAAANALELNR